MNAYGVVTGPGEVRLERLLPGPAGAGVGLPDGVGEAARMVRRRADAAERRRAMELTFRNSELSSENEPVPDKYKAAGGHGQPRPHPARRAAAGLMTQPAVAVLDRLEHGLMAVSSPIHT